MSDDSRVALSDGGISVSRLAAGCWRLTDQTAGDVRAVHRFIDAALELRITTFDHADIYGGYAAEALFGRALKERPSLRDGIELVTKCGIAPISAERRDHRVLHLDSRGSSIVSAAERSLEAFGTDHLEALLLHRPDPLMDPDDVADAFVQLREQGKVRVFGVSNFSTSQLALLQSRVPFQLITNQIELSLLHTASLHDGTLASMHQNRLPVLAWSPLAGGRLLTPGPERDEKLFAVLKRVAEQHGVSPAAIAIAWLLRLPACVVPIIGTSDPERLRGAARGAAVFLDRQDWFELYAAAGNRVA